MQFYIEPLDFQSEWAFQLIKSGANIIILVTGNMEPKVDTINKSRLTYFNYVHSTRLGFLGCHYLAQYAVRRGLTVAEVSKQLHARLRLLSGGLEIHPKSITETVPYLKFFGTGLGGGAGPRTHTGEV